MNIKTESKLGNKEYRQKTNIYQSSKDKQLLSELQKSIDQYKSDAIDEITSYEIMREHFISYKNLITTDEENFYIWDKNALSDLNIDQISDLLNQCSNLLEWYEKYPLVFKEFYDDFIESRNINLDFLT